MKVYTGFFAKAEHYESLGLQKVSIALSPAPGFKGPAYLRLAPTWDLLRAYKTRLIDDAGYTRRFNDEVLSPLQRGSVLSELEAMSGGKDVVLLCWEGPAKFCHRHLVAAWLGLAEAEV